VPKLIKSLTKGDDANRRVSDRTTYVDNLEKKKGNSDEVNDSQSMHQAPDSRMGPNKYPVTKLPGH